MSNQQQRKPLLRFENSEKAQLISTSMPSGGSRKRRSVKKSGSASTNSRKPKVIKGRVNLRVPGYLGLQKLAPSALIPYLPASKLKQAAKKALSKNKSPALRRQRKKKKKTKN